MEVEEENVIENRPKVRELLTEALSLLCVLEALSKNEFIVLSMYAECFISFFNLMCDFIDNM